MHALRTVLNGMLVAAALTAALTAAGCGPRIDPPVEPREDPHGWPQINLASRELQGRIAVRRPMVSQDEAGLMFVTVPLRNATSRQMTIEYRATFFDRNRLPIEETTWFPQTLTPHTQQTFTINSSNPNADDFQIDIRPAK
jgi:hypothetical protein